jgi:hypothetical protein
MPYRSLLLLFGGILLGLAHSILPITAQVRVDASISIQDAINRLVGQGVRVTNIRVDCPGNGGRPYGYFTDNTGTLGISDGLIMTNGAASNAVGPNNSGTMGQSNKNEKQDDDLRQIIQNNEKQFDPCIIEFDIEVFADTLTFDYVFGSEEYLEFIKDYHDVFGFFISGPGISGKVNLALVPGTTSTVSVQNINNNTNSQFYIDNGTGATPFDNLFVQYDGFTKRLQSKIGVQPCQKYQLKFAICDIKDDIYDAGIFIAGKSLRTQAPTLSVRYQFPDFSTGLEGCNGAFVKVTRKSRISEAITFGLMYSGTASRDLDYGQVPDTLRFNPGETEKEFFISILSDQEKDDNENLEIELINPCPGLPKVDGISIPIKENFPYTVPDLVICKGNKATLNGGLPAGYVYQWSPSGFLSCTECPNPIASPEETSLFIGKARHEASGCEALDTFQIKVEPLPIAQFDYSTREDYTSFDISFKNQSQFADQFLWNFGDGSSSQEENPFHAYPIRFDLDSVEYPIVFQAISSAGCADTSFAKVKISNPLFIPNLLTANGDNQNDAFFVKGIKSGIWNFQVFNRWGKEIFQTGNYQLDWKAENQTPGVYFFKLSNPPGDRVFTGWVTVFK